MQTHVHCSHTQTAEAQFGSVEIAPQSSRVNYLYGETAGTLSPEPLTEARGLLFALGSQRWVTHGDFEMDLVPFVPRVVARLRLCDEHRVVRSWISVVRRRKQ